MRMPCREHDPAFWAAWVENNPEADLEDAAKSGRLTCDGCHNERSPQPGEEKEGT